MGEDLSMLGRKRYYGSLYLGILSGRKSQRVISRMLTVMGSVSRTGSTVSGLNLVLMTIYFSNGDKNCRIEYPCSL